MLLLEDVDNDKYLNTHILTCYGLTEESFGKGLANLEKNGYIQRKPDNNFYFTPNWAIYDEYKKDVD